MADQNNPEKVIETDVLGIGGGIAGCFAAVKAREQGVDVTLVTKGNIGRSGQSPWAHGTMAVSPDLENKIPEMMKQAFIGGGYLKNSDWTGRGHRGTYARVTEL